MASALGDWQTCKASSMKSCHKEVVGDYSCTEVARCIFSMLMKSNSERHLESDPLQPRQHEVFRPNLYSTNTCDVFRLT